MSGRPRMARFKVVGRFDGRFKEATVEIDRTTFVVTVRPKRSRRVYIGDLNTVAAIIYERTIKAELRAKLAERAAKRRSRRSR